MLVGAGHPVPALPAMPWLVVAQASMSTAPADAFLGNNLIFSKASHSCTQASSSHISNGWAGRDADNILVVTLDRIGLLDALFVGQGIGWMAASKGLLLMAQCLNVTPSHKVMFLRGPY